MPIIVNGHEFTDAEIEAILPEHQQAANPLRAATRTLVLKQVLADEARRRGIDTTSEEAMLDALLAQAVPVTSPDDNECQRFYAANPQRFTVGELVEAAHILFQVTPSVDLDALRKRAEKALEELLGNPELFVERARTLSNCPSGEVGGNLGQISRGDTVPEFEKAVFSLTPGTIATQLVETRFGLHIVRVERHVEGKLLPFDKVKEEIRQGMLMSRQDAAWQQFIRRLVSEADISGITEAELLDAPLAPLAQ